MKAYGIYTRGYCGVKEVLIWGWIPAVAIVNSFKIEDFRRIGTDNLEIQSILKLDLIANSRQYWVSLSNELAFDTTDFSPSKKGRLIGIVCKSLGFQSTYIKDIAIAFNDAWGFVHEEDLSDYVAGVWDGFGGQVPSAISSLTTPIYPQPDTDMEIGSDDHESEGFLPSSPCEPQRLSPQGQDLPPRQSSSSADPSQLNQTFKSGLKLFDSKVRSWVPYQRSSVGRHSSIQASENNGRQVQQEGCLATSATMDRHSETPAAFNSRTGASSISSSTSVNFSNHSMIETPSPWEIFDNDRARVDRWLPIRSIHNSTGSFL
jgi:hypothetical protein